MNKTRGSFSDVTASNAIGSAVSKISRGSKPKSNLDKKKTEDKKESVKKEPVKKEGKTAPAPKQPKAKITTATPPKEPKSNRASKPKANGQQWTRIGSDSSHLPSVNLEDLK